mmetsp:Transcript_35581/g.65386  ORF Transcript_35581/g.65386 Transcript_35581/m.65386 type:complete len:108 (+) Transcript_35581:757-1080(+)
MFVMRGERCNATVQKALFLETQILVYTTTNTMSRASLIQQQALVKELFLKVLRLGEQSKKTMLWIILKTSRRCLTVRPQATLLELKGNHFLAKSCTESFEVNPAIQG